MDTVVFLHGYHPISFDWISFLLLVAQLIVAGAMIVYTLETKKLRITNDLLLKENFNKTRLEFKPCLAVVGTKPTKSDIQISLEDDTTTYPLYLNYYKKNYSSIKYIVNVRNLSLPVSTELDVYVFDRVDNNCSVTLGEGLSYLEKSEEWSHFYLTREISKSEMETSFLKRYRIDIKKYSELRSDDSDFLLLVYKDSLNNTYILVRSIYKVGSGRQKEFFVREESGNIANLVPVF